ncbi:PilZ domain-containing protein [uncultured Oscillibacter sp.]|uniref:PilZ domain-containing protein n=1 Tax=uncultured Oscillibacter sp. TaxID=876091 RepID=UPI0025EF3A46|nr:PilZ domain-containing protein [uncultured Oscillibacter sp.]
MSERQEERLYLLLDSVNTPLARGRMEGPANGNILQMLVLDNDVEKVAKHEVIVLMSMSGSEPPLQCRIVRQRGDRVALEKIASLDPDLRRNLRVPIKFDTFIYPITGQWRGRRAVQSIDLSCGGVAFYGDDGLEIGEKLEMVIPVTEEPVLLRCQILRRQELRNDKVLYAIKFVDMCDNEEVTVREAVFSIQLENRPHTAGDDNREEQR